MEAGAVVTISDLTIRGGDLSAGVSGGGINNAGTLTLRRVSVADNISGADGGGIQNAGTLTILDSGISGNSAVDVGGGINSLPEASLIVRGSLIEANQADEGGGVSGSSLVATGTQIVRNHADGNGGGLVLQGPASLTDVVVAGNSALAGGGLRVTSSADPVVLRRVVLRGNTLSGRGGGGGILNQGLARAFDTVVAENSALNAGGISNSGTLTFSRGAIVSNSGVFGGGLNNLNGMTTLTNVTISGNGGGGSSEGGGIESTGGTTNLINVTLSENFAETGGNINNSGVVNAQNTIVANALAGGECAGTEPVDQGNNLVLGDETCNLPTATALSLFPLGNNGGPSPTQAIAPGDDAVNAGANCPTTDQRGVPRPQGGGCDIGAYELARCLGGIVNRVGTPGPDRLTGDPSAEVFLTLGGKDVVSPGAGADRVCTGAGNDTVRIRGGGKDRANGGSGHDRVQRDASDVVRAFEVFF